MSLKPGYRKIWQCQKQAPKCRTKVPGSFDPCLSLLNGFVCNGRLKGIGRHHLLLKEQLSKNEASSSKTRKKLLGSFHASQLKLKSKQNLNEEVLHTARFLQVDLESSPPPLLVCLCVQYLNVVVAVLRY